MEESELQINLIKRRRKWKCITNFYEKGESESVLQTFLKIGESIEKSETFPAGQEEQCAGTHHSEIKDTRDTTSRELLIKSICWMNTKFEINAILSRERNAVSFTVKVLGLWHFPCNDVFLFWTLFLGMMSSFPDHSLVCPSLWLAHLTHFCKGWARKAKVT